MFELKWWQTAVFYQIFPLFACNQNQSVLVILEFSDSGLDLDFSRTKEIKGRELNSLFSSAERSMTVKSPRSLEIAPFEALIAEVQL